MSPRWVHFLAEAGIDAIHWSDVGVSNSPDSQIMTWAAEHEHVIVTQDLDFSALHATSRNSQPSIVQIRAVDTDIHLIGQIVVTAIRERAAELACGAILTLDTTRSRLRPLPL